MSKVSFASTTFSGTTFSIFLDKKETHSNSIFVFFSGPQFADIVMDQCQTDDKLGIDIKDEVGEKCEVHGKKQSEFFVEC